MDAKLCSGGNENGVGPVLAEALVCPGNCCDEASGTASDGVLTSTAMMPAKPTQASTSAATATTCSDDHERAMPRTASIARMGIPVDVELQIDDVGVDGGASVAELCRARAHIDIVDEQQRRDGFEPVEDP